MLINELSQVQRESIIEAIDREDSIVELEYFDINIKTINELEESKYKIEDIETLSVLTDQEILSIPNIGGKILRNLKDALKNYSMLEEHKKNSHYKLKRLRVRKKIN